ncbi:MAG: hypothetical protein LAQ30_06625 [Acidobacteriia bacterium]|nr:hypothetical protein [Terriglobia bacterium]
MRKLALLIALAALAAFGQRHKIENIDIEKPDGKLLQQIMGEDDPAKQSGLLEQFAAEYPKHEAMGWVLEQLQKDYLKTDQPDKALAAGEKLLAMDPEDTETALQNLKAAEAKKDSALILKWSAAASALARKVAATPQPKEAEEAAAWKTEVDYAKQVDTYTEYALFRAGLESHDPKTTIGLLEPLEERNPKSEYVPRAADVLFVAYRQAGFNDKALALAERTVAAQQTNEDMLLMVADDYLQKKKEPEKAHAYAAKVIELMAQKPKPEGVADADWTARKNMVTGVARFVDAKLYYEGAQFARADQELRAALPMVESNAAMKAETLFYLGFANYKMEKIQEAVNFYRACAAIPGPFQATANKNIAGIKREYTGIK